MTAKHDPVLNLAYGYDLGENGWNVGMDANMKRLASTSYIYVISKSTTTPPAVVNGARYIIPIASTGAWSTHIGELAVGIEGSWNYFTPVKGWEVRVSDESDAKYWFDSTDWLGAVPLDSGLVHTTGAETITGAKSFTTSINVPTSATAGDAVNNTRLDTVVATITPVNLGAGLGLYVDKTGVSPNFKSFVAGDNVTIDSTATDLTINANVVGGGQVVTIVAGTGVTVNAADPANPIVAATGIATGIAAGSAVVGEDSVTNELDLEIGQTAAEDIFAGIVKPLLLNKPATDLKTVIGGVFDAFGILGAVLGCIHDIARTGATRVVTGILGDNAGSPTSLAASQYDHDGTTGQSIAQLVTNGISVSLIEDGAGESVLDVSAVNSIKIASYANLAAITAAIGTPSTGMLVRVAGQGLATYTGAAWVLASNDTIAIT